MTAWQRMTIGVVAALTTGCAGVWLPPNEPLGRAPSRYVTYFVLDPPSSSEPTESQLKSAIAKELADRGLAETPPEDAQAVVVVNRATTTERSREDFYFGWGGWNWQVGSPQEKGQDVYAPGTLVVDMFDADTKQMIWHGSEWLGDHNRSSAEANAIEKTVSRLFRTFPVVGEETRGPLNEDQSFDAEAMRIIFSSSPAILVQVDGEPRYEPIAGTRLERVVNTDALIIRNHSGIHYLRFGDAWMEADDLTGPWSLAGMAPDDADVALAFTPLESQQRQLATTSADAYWRPIYVMTTPAALVVTDGSPQFTRVAGTSLSRVSNTATPVYREPTDQELYVSVSGNWYRAWTTDGPWQHVSDDQLPSDITAVS